MERFGGFSELVAKRARETPGRTCLRFFADGAVRSITWAQFERAVAARAARLARAGVRSEAVLPDGSVDSVVEVFAASEAGSQVALIDANCSDDEAMRRARLCDADALWCTGRRRASLGNAWQAYDAQRGCAAVAENAREGERGGAGRGDMLTDGAGASCAEEDAGRVGGCAAGPVPGAVLFFTSGTTSAGKAVRLSDRSLMASAFNGASLLPLNGDDELLCVLPLSHVFGFVCGLLWGMECGVPVALGRGMRWFYQDLSLFDPTVCPLVPTLLEHALDARAFGARLRLVLVGASPCPVELARRVRAEGIDVSAGYGLTETSSGVALSLGSDTDAMTVCPEAAVRISDTGEVLVKAPTCLMEGYYGAAAPAAALSDGFFATGDEGFLDARGRLHVTGRMGDVIVLPNGEKVRIRDCERALARELGENDCALVEAKGRPVLVLGAVSAKTAACSKDALLKRASHAVAGCARGSLIADVVSVGHALPRTASGDVKRWQVQEEVRRWQRRKK